MRARWVRAALALASVFAGAAIVPRACCGRDAERYARGDLQMERALADGVTAQLERGVSSSSFATGSARFDGEWSLVTHQMAVLGLGQVILTHPELRDRYRRVMERAVDAMVRADAYAFGTDAWGEAGLSEEALASDRGHAYLGYTNLALGMVRLVDPQTRFSALHDALTSALARRLEAAPYGVLETYPGEAYPADTAACVGSLGLHTRATRNETSHAGTLAHYARLARAHQRDEASGLFYQSIDARTGAVLDSPRGSGTALASYFLAFADRSLSSDLYHALRLDARASFLGFGGTREYARDARAGDGDIDSGPVFFGVGVSATGFTIGPAAIHEDHDRFVALVRTLHLFGVPHDRDGQRHFLSGGALGDAIMLAMLTAGPGTALREGAP